MRSIGNQSPGRSPLKSLAGVTIYIVTKVVQPTAGNPANSQVHGNDVEEANARLRAHATVEDLTGDGGALA